MKAGKGATEEPRRGRRTSNVFRGGGLSPLSRLLRLSVSDVKEVSRECRVDFVFVISVVYSDLSWKVSKRHQELESFAENMMAHNKHIKSFPSKSNGRLSLDKSPSKVEDVNEWFTHLVESTSFPSGSEIESQLFHFLELYLHQGAQEDRMGRSKPNKVIHLGYLRKLGGNKAGAPGNWKRRFMVLKQHLRYYEDEDTFRCGGLPKGIIRLNAFCVEKKLDGLMNEFVIHTMPFPLVCRASTPEDRDEWINALQLCGSTPMSASPSLRDESDSIEDNSEEITWCSR